MYNDKVAICSIANYSYMLYLLTVATYIVMKTVDMKFKVTLDIVASYWVHT